MGLQIRFRTDDSNHVQMRMKGTAWADHLGVSQETYEALSPALPGDTWRLRWYAEHGEGPIAGYAIWCPKCNDLHHWTTATNCRQGGQEHSYKDEAGTEHRYYVCGHSGVGSCWQWSGSAEDGTLTARPSLLCHTCGFHGWLTNGVLSDC